MLTTHTDRAPADAPAPTRDGRGWVLRVAGSNWYGKTATDVMRGALANLRDRLRAEGDCTAPVALDMGTHAALAWFTGSSWVYALTRDHEGPRGPIGYGASGSDMTRRDCIESMARHLADLEFGDPDPAPDVDRLVERIRDRVHASMRRADAVSIDVEAIAGHVAHMQTLRSESVTVALA